MATTLYSVWDTEAAISVTGFNNLANGADATSDAVDNTTNRYHSALVEVAITGTASGTGDAAIYLVRGIDGSTYEVDGNSGRNIELLGTMTCNATTLVRSIFFVENLGPYFKILIRNDSGQALGGSGNAVSYRGLNIKDT